VGFLVRYAIGVSLPHPNVTAKYSKLQETVRFVHDDASRITGTLESASDASG
jgi:hypothetical protein